jgi:cation diffusion facilitator CzcD-associated flavoprotein CzcO
VVPILDFRRLSKWVDWSIKYARDCDPGVQDQDKFPGVVLTGQGLTRIDMKNGEGKRVVVVGAGKSALDAAGNFAEVASSVTMLTRKVSRLNT